MYSPLDFNRYDLFQKFNGWFESAREQFVEKYNGVKYSEDISKEWIKFDQSFDMVLIHANFIIINIRQMKLLEKKLIREYEKFKDKTNVVENQLIYWSPTLVSFLSNISPILSSIIFIQDKMMQLVSKKLSITLPSNMRRIISKGNKEYGILSKIFFIIRRYWTKSGKLVRSYWNIDQHHFALITHSSLMIKPKYKLEILLPDNPEVKKLEEFSYCKEIDALHFLETNFFRLHDFIEELASEFGFNEKAFQLKSNLGSYGELMNKEGTVALAVYDSQKPEGLHIAHKDGKLILNIIRP